MTQPAPRLLTPLEIGSGILLRRSRARPALPARRHSADPRTAFEAGILPSLRRAPCLVSFSGGRDSSAVLAVATALARREGLPEPIPVTHRFPSAARTHESAWQEQVVRHLHLDKWLRIEAGEELGGVGPVAQRVLRRHGLLWPCNAYFHAPVFQAASGGSVLTGVGGDEAFGSSTWERPIAVLGGRARPRPRDALRVGFAVAPRPVKRAVIRSRMPELFPWLRPDARRAVTRAIVADAAREPLRWRARNRALLGSAAMETTLTSLAVLGADHDVEVAHPFASAAFLGALAAQPRDQRHRSRSEAMTSLVGDLLPSALLTRSTKARFDEVLWTPESRALAASWTGEGVLPDVVDLDGLAAEWRSPDPAPHTITLLQSVWLSRDRAVAPSPAQATTTAAAG